MDAREAANSRTRFAKMPMLTVPSWVALSRVKDTVAVTGTEAGGVDGGKGGGGVGSGDGGGFVGAGGDVGRLDGGKIGLG